MGFIDSFINAYNDYLSSKKSIFDDVQLIEKAKKFEGLDTLLNFPFNFFKAFNFPYTYNYSGFCFIETPITDGQFIDFAFHGDYNMYYVFDSSSQKVFLRDDEEIWPCSENVSIFFNCMTHIMQLKRKALGEVDLELPKEVVREVYLFCMKQNGNYLAYERFFEHITGL